MAEYYKPDQNLRFNVPDINEAFVGSGYGQGSGTDDTVYINTNGEIKGINLRDIGEQLTGKSNSLYGSDNWKAGLEYFKQQTGLDPTKLKQYNLGDVSTYAKDKGYKFQGANQFLTSGKDISPFLNLQPAQIGSFTVPVDPNLQALIAAGGAGAGGFAAGGSAGIAAGQAMSQTPEALANQEKANIENALPPTPTPGSPNATPGSPASTYTGPSIVDYLKSVGQPSDFTSRSKLAQSMGIQNYSGTAEQNTQLLGMLRGGTTPLSPTPGGSLFSTPLGGNATGAIGEGSGGGPDFSSIFSQYGIDTTGISGSSNPMQSFADTYKKVYSDLGLDSLSQQYDSFAQQIKDIDAERIEKISSINENPWLSEGLRSKLVSRMAEKYDQKRSDLADFLQIIEGHLDNGRQEAQFVAGKILEGFFKQQSFNQDLILKSIDSAEKEALARMKTNTQVVDVGGEKRLINADTGATIAVLGKSTPTTKPDTITLSEAKSFGLPLSLVGASQDQIIADLNKPQPPTWFSDLVKQDWKPPMVFPDINSEWKKFSSKILGATSLGGSSGGEGSPDFGSLNLPAPVQ